MRRSRISKHYFINEVRTGNELIRQGAWIGRAKKTKLRIRVNPAPVDLC